MDRLVDPRNRRNATWLCTALGAWGVLSGFAIFLKVQEEAEVKAATLPAFIVALLIASIVAFISERISGLIEESSSHDEHASIVSANPDRRFVPRLVAGICMLALFELFVTAWHSLAESGFHGQLQHLINNAVLPATENKSDRLDLTLMVLLWMTMGSVIAGILGWFVFNLAGRFAVRARWGMLAGVLAGAIGAPILVSVYVLVVRSADGIVFFARKNDAWLNTIEALGEQHKDSILAAALALVQLLGLIWRIRYAGPLLVLAVFAGVVVAARRWRWALYPAAFLSVGLVMGFAAPLFADTGAQFWQIPALAALVWLFPGAILGALAPRLRNPSENLGAWGVLSFVAAGLLLLVRYLTLAENSVWYAIVAVTVSGLVLLRSRRIQDYWPLVALIVAMLVTGVNMLAHATFFNVFEGVYAANSLPPWVDRALERELNPGVRKMLGELLGQQDYLRLQDALEATRATELDQQPKAITAVLGKLDEAELNILDRRWRDEHWQMGLPFFSLPATVQSNDKDLADGVDDLQRLGYQQQLVKMDGLVAEAHRRLSLMPAGPALPPMTFDGHVVKPFPGCQSGYIDRRCALVVLQAALTERREDLQLLFEQHAVSDHLMRHVSPLVDSAGNAGQQLRQLEDLRAQMEERRKAAEDKLKWRDDHVELHLEMSLAGSLGFWVTVGLLAGWALLRSQPLTITGPGGRSRCFWASGNWQQFHDTVHGRLPTSDADFFHRLAFEIVGMGAAPSMLPDLWDRCSKLEVTQVAALDAGSLARQLGVQTDTLARSAQGARLTMVIENAARLLTLSPTPEGALLVHTRLRAAGDSPETLIAELRRLFRLPSNFAAGTYLQSVGELPDAHYHGCYLSTFAAGGGHA